MRICIIPLIYLLEVLCLRFVNSLKFVQSVCRLCRIEGHKKNEEVDTCL